ncbi:MAG: ATP-binding protein [Candidatus Rokuibacteriota bacterium]
MTDTGYPGQVFTFAGALPLSPADRRRRLRQELAVRAAVALLILVFIEVLVVLGIQSFPAEGPGLAIMRGSALLGLLLAVPYVFWMRTGRGPRAQAYVRMTLDVLLVTAGLYGAGGLAAAPYLAVHSIVPVYAGIMLSSRACLIAAATATLSYLLVALLAEGGTIPRTAPHPPDGWPVAAFNLLVVNVVGALTALLAAAYRTSRRRLYANHARLEALLELSHELARIHAWESLRERVVEACRRLLDVRLVGFHLLERKTAANTLTDEGSREADRPGVALVDEHLGAIVAATAEPLVIQDLSRDLRLPPPARAATSGSPYRAWLGVPLKAGPDVLGVLSIWTERPGGFSPDDVRLAVAFAAQAAIALENARLIREARQAYDELSRTQTRLAQAQKMEALGRLAGGVAHDFNNMLGGVLAAAGILLQRVGSDEKLRRHVSTIEQIGTRAANLTRQLLAFSRARMLKPRVVDLNGLMTGMAPVLKGLIGERIELLLEPAARDARVKADPSQLEQVILNLVVNARDAMPDGGRLVIRSADAAAMDVGTGTPGPARVLLDVSDTGIGMDAETRARIFEPFFTTKPAGKGTGLGLAMVFGIVKQSGGHVEVESDPGKGSRFRVSLPRVEAAVELDDRGEGEDRGRGGSGTILLAEDQDELRELLRETLVDRGYTVLPAADGLEALDVAARHPGRIDLLLTDVVMPRLNGSETADRLVAVRPDVKVIYMTGHTDDAVLHQGVQDGSAVLMQKPFTPEALARQVRQVLECAVTRAGAAARRSSARPPA